MSHSITSINRSLTPKIVTDFYVSFYGLPENIANIMGRQCKSFERPTITFNTYERHQKGKRIQDSGRLLFDPISMVFEDDNNGLCSQALYYQVLRQAGTAPLSSQDTFENASFEVNVKLYNSEDDVVENFTLVDCFISSIAHSESIMSDTTESVITVLVGFNDIKAEFPILDEELAIDYVIDEFGSRIINKFGAKLLG